MENEKKKTGYQSTWQDQLRDTASKIINREKFTYDLNGDALYKQYKDRYIQQGKQAMMDTMGQAAALTGGYGNSYAQTVGQQTYQGYLHGLNDQVPALYQLALDKYNSEGDQLRGNMSLLMQQDDIDYGRYRDDIADRDNAFSKLMALMTGYGYKPTAEEMAAAGMTDAQMREILGIKDGVGGVGGTGGNGGPPKDPPVGPPKATSFDDLSPIAQEWVRRNYLDSSAGNLTERQKYDYADRLNKSGLTAQDGKDIHDVYGIPLPLNAEEREKKEAEWESEEKKKGGG
jgi:hypothetical protein